VEEVRKKVGYANIAWKKKGRMGEESDFGSLGRGQKRKSLKDQGESACTNREERAGRTDSLGLCTAN